MFVFHEVANVNLLHACLYFMYQRMRIYFVHVYILYSCECEFITCMFAFRVAAIVNLLCVYLYFVLMLLQIYYV